VPVSARVDVLGEARTLPVGASARGATFTDDFSRYGVHLYHVTY
jgi:hypothetical protein